MTRTAPTTPPHPTRTHVGRDYLVTALAEFYDASGFGATASHREDPSARAVPPLSSGSGRPAADSHPTLIAARDGGHRFVAGTSTELSVSVFGAAPVHVRDSLPADWSVTEDDAYTTFTRDGVRYVEFSAPITAGTRTYVAEPPADASPRSASVGPLEFSPDGGATWLSVDATTRTNTVPRVGSRT